MVQQGGVVDQAPTDHQLPYPPLWLCAGPPQRDWEELHPLSPKDLSGPGYTCLLYEQISLIPVLSLYPGSHGPQKCLGARSCHPVRTEVFSE